MEVNRNCIGYKGTQDTSYKHYFFKGDIKMCDKTVVIEQEGVIIKQEHAYASKDDNTILPVYETSEDDPLRIMPSDVEGIKTENDCEIIENVEIKVEPDLGHIIEPNNDMDTSDYSGDVNTTDMEFTENPISVDNMTFSGDFVPKAAFTYLQSRYKNIYNQYVLSIRQKKIFTSENKVLKNEINNLKKGSKVTLNESLKQLKKEIRGAHLMGNNLKYEINCLAKQNLFLRKKLMDCVDVAKYEETMEKNTIELKKKVQNFIRRERKLHDNFTNMKSELEFKEREQKILETRLQRTIFNFEILRQKIYQQSKLRSLYYESKKQRDRLQKELTDCMKVRYLYEDHADLIKREMNIKLKESEMENEKYKKEIDHLSKICFQNATTVTALREKLKTKSQALETKISETGKMYIHEKQKATSLQEKVLEKHNENVALKKEIELMKPELEKYRKANLEEKIREKQRANVMLREEVAILKVELEKARPKFMQC